MPKLNHTLTDTGYFEIDNKQHLKGVFDIDANPSNETLGIYNVSNNGRRSYLVDPTIYSQWTNNEDEAYGSYDSLVNDLRICFYQSIGVGLSISNSIDRIYNDYGDIVRVKPKALFKFGKNGNIGTTSETVWDQGGNEVLPSGNTIDTVSSSDASDTQIITVEGHTESSGILTFVTQQATLNGQNQVTLSTPLYRSSRLINSTETGDGNGLGDFAGTVYCYESGGTVTGGVPQNPDDIHLVANGEGNQSNKCATSISNSDYWILTSFIVGVKRSGGQSRKVDFNLQKRSQTGVWRTIARLTSSTESGATSISFTPNVIIEKNSDIRVTAISSGNATEVDASLNGYLANVIT